MDDTKELIARLNAMKDSLQVCVNHMNNNIIQAGILGGSVTVEPYTTVLTKLHEITYKCTMDIYNLGMLCSLLENSNEEGIIHKLKTYINSIPMIYSF